MSLPPDPFSPVTHELRRRALLTGGVSAVTRLTTAFALTATGAIVGALGHQAHVRDAAASHPEAAPKVVVVPKPVARPVRTVVVRRPGAPRSVAALQRSTTSRSTVSPPRTRSQVSAPKRTAPAPAPKATQAPAATTSTGS